MTAEFRRGMIRTTFAASPAGPGAGGQGHRARRVAFGRAGRQRRDVPGVQRTLTASRARPPRVSLADPTVLRAVVGTAASSSPSWRC